VFILTDGIDILFRSISLVLFVKRRIMGSERLEDAGTGFEFSVEVVP